MKVEILTDFFDSNRSRPFPIQQIPQGFVPQFPIPDSSFLINSESHDGHAICK